MQETTGGVDEARVHERIAQDLWRSTPVLVFVILAVTLMFWSTTRENAEVAASDTWALAMCVAMALRGGLYMLWRSRRGRRLSDQCWIRLFAAAGLVAGVAWSLMFLTISDWTRLELVAPSWMLMFGVVSAACTSLWPHLPSFVLYTLPMILVGGGGHLLHGHDDLRWLIPSLALYYAVLVIFTKLTNRLYIDSILLEASNASLLRSLERQTRDQESIIDERTAALVEHKESLEFLASHDPLTGLPNRQLLLESLQTRIALHRGSFALLFIDLDHFKEINDSLGHSVGDALLQAIAERLLEVVRQADTVARLGGDEFTVLLNDVSGATVAHGVSHKLLEALARPVDLPAHRLVVSASIGVCMFPEDGSTSEQLLRNADAAMYRAKAMGRNTVCRYSPDMTARALSRISLEGELRRAVADGDLAVAYQPQVDMHEGRLVGVEALLRWNHPERGLISPADFIPIAEDTGIIRTLGLWVLEEVCAAAAAGAASCYAGVSFAVNVSARQLLDPGFEDRVGDILAQHRRDAPVIEFELTESALIQNPQRVLRIMEKLRAKGVSFAVDDFGTGYSSLSRLKNYPIHKLKIDGSFVRDLSVDESDRAIASAVIGLGRSLGLTVIAEGVETEAQRDILLAEGCTLGQGFLYAHALSAEDLRRFSEAHSAKRSLH